MPRLYRIKWLRSNGVVVLWQALNVLVTCREIMVSGKPTVPLGPWVWHFSPSSGVGGRWRVPCSHGTGMPGDRWGFALTGGGGDSKSGRTLGTVAICAWAPSWRRMWRVARLIPCKVKNSVRTVRISRLLRLLVLFATLSKKLKMRSWENVVLRKI